MLPVHVVEAWPGSMTPEERPRGIPIMMEIWDGQVTGMFVRLRSGRLQRICGASLCQPYPRLSPGRSLLLCAQGSPERAHAGSRGAQPWVADGPRAVISLLFSMPTCQEISQPPPIVRVPVPRRPLMHGGGGLGRLG